jgi:hypothetical protein
MATYSGTTAFDLSIDEIATEAYERCGIEVRDGWDMQTARRSFNILIAEWANRGLNLWTLKETSKALTATTIELSGSDLFGSTATASAALIDMVQLIVVDGSNDFSTTQISQATYNDYTVKTTSGRPTQWYFERTILPKLFLYPAADKAYTLKYWALERMDDAGAYTNNAQIPFRFIPALTAGLAFYLSQKKAPDRMQALKLLYEDEFKRAADEDGSRASLYLTPHAYYPAGV